MTPEELEKWKKQIYGVEYYEEDVPATSPIFNQHRGQEQEQLCNNDACTTGSPSRKDRISTHRNASPMWKQQRHQQQRRQQSGDDDDPGSPSTMDRIVNHIKSAAAAAAASAPIWNHKKQQQNQPRSGNNNNNNDGDSHKWQKLIYGDEKWQKLIYGDEYFNDNIAAVSSEWDDEDLGKNNKAKYFFSVLRKKQQQLVLVIAIALFATAMTTLAIVHLSHSHKGGGDQQVQNTPLNLFETNDADLVIDERFQSSSTSVRAVVQKGKHHGELLSDDAI